MFTISSPGPSPCLYHSWADMHMEYGRWKADLYLRVYSGGTLFGMDFWRHCSALRLWQWPAGVYQAWSCQRGRFGSGLFLLICWPYRQELICEVVHKDDAGIHCMSSHENGRLLATAGHQQGEGVQEQEVRIWQRTALNGWSSICICYLRSLAYKS